MKQLAPFLIALGLVVLLDISITLSPFHLFLDHQAKNYYDVKWNELMHDTPRQMDVLLLGTSRSDAGFKTDVFEKAAPYPINAFNLGLVRDDYSVMQLILENYVESYGKPRVVMLEAADFMMNDRFPFDNNTLYLWQMVRQNPAITWEILQHPDFTPGDRLELSLSFISGLYRYRFFLTPQRIPVLMFHYAKHILSPIEKPQQCLQGWHSEPVRPEVFRNAQRVESTAAARQQHLMQNLSQVSPLKLQRILEFCRQQNIPVVLIQWPTHPEYTKFFKQSPFYQPYSKEVARLAEQYHAPFLDLSTAELPSGKNAFADTDHLSGIGASYYTRVLARRFFDLPEMQQLFQPRLSSKALPSGRKRGMAQIP